MPAHCRRHLRLRSICARPVRQVPIPTVHKPNVPLALPALTQTVERAVARGVNRELILRVVRVSVAHAQPVPIPTVPNAPLAPPALTLMAEQAVARSVNRELILRVVRVSVAHAQAVNITIPKVRHLAKNAVTEPMPVVPEIPLAPAVLTIIGAVLGLGHVEEYK